MSFVMRNMRESKSYILELVNIFWVERSIGASDKGKHFSLLSRENIFIYYHKFQNLKQDLLKNIKSWFYW